MLLNQLYKCVDAGVDNTSISTPPEEGTQTGHCSIVAHAEDDVPNTAPTCRPRRFVQLPAACSVPSRSAHGKVCHIMHAMLVISIGCAACSAQRARLTACSVQRNSGTTELAMQHLQPGAGQSVVCLAQTCLQVSGGTGSTVRISPSNASGRITRSVALMGDQHCDASAAESAGSDVPTCAMPS